MLAARAAQQQQQRGETKTGGDVTAANRGQHRKETKENTSRQRCTVVAGWGAHGVTARPLPPAAQGRNGTQQPVVSYYDCDCAASHLLLHL